MFDYAKLPAKYSRNFVPKKADLADWHQIETLYDQLDKQDVSSVELLKKFIANWDELDDCIGEEGTIRTIESDLQTEDKEKEKARLFFVEEIQPKMKPREQALKNKYLSSPGRIQLGPDFAMLDRAVAIEAEIFRIENVGLATDDEILAIDYQKLSGGLTVQFDGAEKTLAQLRPILEETDRGRRESAWMASAQRRLNERDKFEEIFDGMLELRGKIGRNANLPNFRDYAFKMYQRFDYTPADCVAFHDAVEKHIVPLAGRLLDQRRTKMGLESLRPWDLDVDPDGKPPLRPFKSALELEDGTSRIFKGMDQELSGQFELLRKQGLLSLENYKGKAPGGYQATLTEKRLPFIFMNSVGQDQDLQTLVHEAGHAFHTFAARDMSLSSYRHTTSEYSEVASMGMELLAIPYLNEFYANEDDLARATKVRLESIVEILPWIAVVDAFQHWLYTNMGHTRQARRAKWLELHSRFMVGTNWAGLEEERAYIWHRQLHFFVAPFYYIEYGIAQLGALGLWRESRHNYSAAMASYRRSLALGGSKPLPELFKAAGLDFDFSSKTLKPLAGELAEALGLGG